MFLLDTEQISQLSDWDEKEHSECKKKETGACGGRFTYTFTPTGLGTIVKVTCNVCNKEIDLTDYDW